MPQTQPMFTIDLILKYSPMPISVEKKDAQEAEAVYQKLIEAMQSPTPLLVELTCDKQTDKKVAVKSDHINGVIVSQKSGGNAAGKVAGFFATNAAQ